MFTSQSRVRMMSLNPVFEWFYCHEPQFSRESHVVLFHLRWLRYVISCQTFSSQNEKKYTESKRFYMNFLFTLFTFNCSNNIVIGFRNQIIFFNQVMGSMKFCQIYSFELWNWDELSKLASTLSHIGLVDIYYLYHVLHLCALHSIWRLLAFTVWVYQWCCYCFCSIWRSVQCTNMRIHMKTSTAPLSSDDVSYVKCILRWTVLFVSQQPLCRFNNRTIPTLFLVWFETTRVVGVNSIKIFNCTFAIAVSSYITTANSIRSAFVHCEIQTEHHRSLGTSIETL